MVQLTVWPAAGTISQLFGKNSTLDPAYQRSEAYRIYGNYQPAGHLAFDIACKHRTPVYAAHDGRMRFSGAAVDMPRDVANQFMHAFGPAAWPSGNCAMLDAGDGSGTTYSHLDEVNAAIYDNTDIAAGTLLGWAGTTGRSTGTHLHFEYVILPAPNDGWQYGRKDPLLYFPAGWSIPTAPGGTGAPAPRKTRELIPGVPGITVEI